jgi:hypothetical protein
MATSGGHYAPAALRNRADEIDSAGHYGDAVAIIRLAAFELPNFRFRIEVRSDYANHFDRADAVTDCYHLLLVNSPLAGPGTPLPLHGASRVDEDSVEIEENGGAAKNGHSFFYHREHRYAENAENTARP